MVRLSAADKALPRFANVAGVPTTQKVAANGAKSYRSFPLDFKQAVVRAHLDGESMYSLALRHGLSRNLVRTWVAKFEAGELGQGGHAVARADPAVPPAFTPAPAQTAGLTIADAFDARIAELERMIGRQALEIEILRDALNRATAGQRGKPRR